MANLTAEQQCEQKHQARAKKRFLKVHFRDVGPLIMPPEGLAYWEDDLGDKPEKIEDVWMTQEEYEALPEFES